MAKSGLDNVIRLNEKSLQMLDPFETIIPAKLVLAGEHAVLRGSDAIVFPYPNKSLKLTYRPESTNGLNITPTSLKLLLEDLLSRLEELTQTKLLEKIAGDIDVESTIPLGGGLGSSAALCVALVEWATKSTGLSNEKKIEIARTLENHFHGKSSGMDVSLCFHRKPILFSIEEGAQPLSIKKIPQWRLVDTGLRARTRDCVLKVQNLYSENQAKFTKVDLLMREATATLFSGLEAYDRGERAGLDQVALGLNHAQKCFYEWGLVPDKVRSLEESLRAEGAIAVKLTGAGMGGFLIALDPE